MRDKNRNNLHSSAIMDVPPNLVHFSMKKYNSKSVCSEYSDLFEYLMRNIFIFEYSSGIFFYSQMYSDIHLFEVSFNDFPIADPSKNFQRILTKNTICTKFISLLKVQRIHKILDNFEPEMENPAQRLQNLQMKY